MDWSLQSAEPVNAASLPDFDGVLWEKIILGDLEAANCCPSKKVKAQELLPTSVDACSYQASIDQVLSDVVRFSHIIPIDEGVNNVRAIEMS